MLRIVFPVGVSWAVSPAASWLIRRAVSAPNVVAVAATNIRVTVKIIIVVDVDGIVAPPSSRQRRKKSLSLRHSIRPADSKWVGRDKPEGRTPRQDHTKVRIRPVDWLFWPPFTSFFW